MGFLKELKAAIKILKDPSGVSHDIVKQLEDELKEASDLLMDHQQYVPGDEKLVRFHHGIMLDRKCLSINRANDNISITIRPGRHIEDQDLLWGLLREARESGDLHTFIMFSPDALDD